MVKLTEEQKCLLILLKENRLVCSSGKISGIFRELVIRHRLLPLMAGKLAEFSDLDRSELDELLKQQVMKSMAITSELSALYKDMKNDFSHILVTKGPLLSQLLYGEVGKRQFNDLDLYVRPDSFPEAFNEMVDLGYKVLYPSIKNPETFNYYFKYKGDIGLINPRNGVYIELHYGINIMKLIPRECESIFFANFSKVEILGKEIFTLNDELHFIYLCIHGAKHQYSRLIWLKDIADFLQSIDIDHASIVSIVQKCGLQYILGLSLQLVTDLFDVKTPDVYAEMISSRRASRLKDICLRRIFGPEREGLKMKIVKYYYFLQLKPGWSYKLHLIKGIFHRWYIKKFMGGH